MTDTAPTLSPTVAAFLGRCEAYRQMTGRTDVWLSKHLLDDTNGLKRLREGKDIFVTRLERAGAKLTTLAEEAKAKLDQEPARKREAKAVLADYGLAPPEGAAE